MCYSHSGKRYWHYIILRSSTFCLMITCFAQTKCQIFCLDKTKRNNLLAILRKEFQNNGD